MYMYICIYKKKSKISGCKSKMKFDEQPSTSRNRNKKIIWFNPQFNQNVKTNIGKLFFKSVRKNFLKNHIFRKIFNLNTLKLSYNSMANLQSLIKQHNPKVLTDRKKLTRLCNCVCKDSCSLGGNCLSKCNVYKAEVTTTGKLKLYYEASDGDFKTRFNNHTSSLNNEKIQYEIKWSIAAYASLYKSGSRRCDLCLTEKLKIMKEDPELLLNKRSDFLSK